jgi:hypothetical protein
MWGGKIKLLLSIVVGCYINEPIGKNLFFSYNTIFSRASKYTSHFTSHTALFFILKKKLLSKFGLRNPSLGVKKRLDQFQKLKFEANLLYVKKIILFPIQKLVNKSN